MASKSHNDVQFKAFINLQLTEADFSAIDQTNMSAEELIMHIAAMVTKGYRIAMSYDAEMRRAKVTAMDVWESRTSAGFMLSAEADTVVTALTVLLYKHTVRMGGDWVPFCNQTRQIAKYR
jgi:hypothetical protein